MGGRLHYAPTVNHWRRRLKRAAIGALATAFVGALTLWLAVVTVDFPPALLAPDTVDSRRIEDRHGRLLRDAPTGERRGVWRPLDEVSPWLPKAFVAIEDHRFEDHRGVDLRGVGRALRDNLRAGRVVAGGSTLSQQVVKQVMPHPRTLWGKGREALWALRLERRLSKRAVLEQYVNRVPFGHGAVGVEAASRLYLGKPAAALTLGEAALLAGIPRAPTRNNPYADPERARRRQRVVLRRMHALGVIDAAQLADALEAPWRVVPPERAFDAPHFTAWVLRRAGAGRVRTTLDLDLQREAERLVAQTVRELADRGVGQGAALVLENTTGDVLAWVGSADFADPEAGQVDMVVGMRQPGSTLKPFAYGLGLELGLTAATPLPDVPIWFPTALGDYRPRNYDRKFHGWVRLRGALANSYNVPAVWIAHRIGVAPLLQRLRAVGFESLERPAEYYGLGLALGNGEVRLLELANAYRTLANEGVRAPVRWRLGGEVPPGTRAMAATTARLLTDILADPVARVPAFGRDNVLAMPFPTAAKTGTSTAFTDNWTVGYTSAVTVAVWVGNFDGRPMEGVSGVSGAGALWHRLVRAAMRGREARAFSREGLERARVCLDTGAPLVADDGCNRAVDELFLPGTAPTAADPAARPLATVRVTFPDRGDLFSADVDTPVGLRRIRMRAEAPAEVSSLVWEVDGKVVETTRRRGDTFSRWWTLTTGAHRVRVWPEGRPDNVSRLVIFEVR